MGGKFRITNLQPIAQVKFFQIFIIVHMLTDPPSFRTRAQHICSAPFKGVPSCCYEMISS